MVYVNDLMKSLNHLMESLNNITYNVLNLLEISFDMFNPSKLLILKFSHADDKTQLMNIFRISKISRSWQNAK